MSDNSEPAFPSNEKHISSAHNRSHLGLTMRDYFAAQAIAPVIMKCVPGECLGNETMAQMFARRAYEAADAMLKQRDE